MQVTGHQKSIGAIERVWGGDKWHIWSGDSAGSIRVWEGEDLRFLRQLDSGQVIDKLLTRGHICLIGFVLHLFRDVFSLSRQLERMYGQGQRGLSKSGILEEY